MSKFIASGNYVWSLSTITKIEKYSEPWGEGHEFGFHVHVSDGYRVSCRCASESDRDVEFSRLLMFIGNALAHIEPVSPLHTIITSTD